MTPQKLREFFEFCGHVVDMELQQRPKEGIQVAIIQFGNATAASTAVLLNNAKLESKFIQVRPYFDQTTATDGTPPAATTATAKEYQANHIAAEWVASGLMLTDSVIQSGKHLLEQFKVTDTLDHVKTVAIRKAAEWNDKFKVTDKAQAIDQKYSVMRRVEEAKNLALSGATALSQKAMQYPIIQNAAHVVQDTVGTASATLTQSQQIYHQRKQSAPGPEPTAPQAPEVD